MYIFEISTLKMEVANEPLILKQNHTNLDARIIDTSKAFKLTKLLFILRWVASKSYKSFKSRGNQNEIRVQGIPKSL